LIRLFHWRMACLPRQLKLKRPFCFDNNKVRLMHCTLNKLTTGLVPFASRVIRVPCDFSRVESWRSCQMVLSPAPPHQPDVRFSRIRLSNHLLPGAFAFTWPSSIASTGVIEIFRVNSVPQSPFLLSFRSMVKVLPLPSPKVMLSLRYKR